MSIYKTELFFLLINVNYFFSKHGLVASGENLLYLAGGEFPDGSVTRCLWRYDPVINEWQDLAPMEYPRSELGDVLGFLILFIDEN